jgi:transcriptional regulator with XRE-family HTH domain
MIQYSDWAKERIEKIKDHPKYMATKLMIEITEQFCNRMKELGISQRELAKRIGKSQPYVAKMMNNGANMTLETIAMFANALEMDVFTPKFVPKETVPMSFDPLNLPTKKALSLK